MEWVFIAIFGGVVLALGLLRKSTGSSGDGGGVFDSHDGHCDGGHGDGGGDGGGGDGGGD
ncbi:hypothetical protein ABID16_003268 [Rhizobium aquaticum]|uniref:Uncharacterized protein n=1 Tax=Rhizobium aquaticum TaxID=1549636 RepID=A0ABV2J2D8_9HYPH